MPVLRDFPLDHRGRQEDVHPLLRVTDRHRHAAPLADHLAARGDVDGRHGRRSKHGRVRAGRDQRGVVPGGDSRLHFERIGRRGARRRDNSRGLVVGERCAYNLTTLPGIVPEMSPEIVATAYLYLARYTTRTSPVITCCDVAVIVIVGAAGAAASAGRPPAVSKLPVTVQAAAIRQSFDTRTHLSPAAGRGSAFRPVQKNRPGCDLRSHLRRMSALIAPANLIRPAGR